MSDDEDNQSLIDEIQALEDALDQKQILANNEYNTYSSCTSSTKVIPKLEINYEEKQKESDTFTDDDLDFIINETDDEYDCKDLQDLLELNKTLMDSIATARDKVISLLDTCISNQRLVELQISKHNSFWTNKIISFNAGMPYFKDKNYFTPKRNEDTETKIRNGELRLADLQRIHRWNQMDKSNLLKAIRHEVTLKLLQKDSSNETYVNNSITKSSQLPVDVKKAIGSLGSMKFDWLKIANNIPENKHSAEECEVMWNVFLHPDINKQRWTGKEDKNLNRIVDEYECEDWDAIAKELNTRRSGYQCFVRYNTNNWKNLMKGQSWTPNDDKILVQLVGKLKMGDYIPWGYIASCMNNWTKQQVYFHWTYSLAPHIKKGRFSEEEDSILLDAIEKYGQNFSKISALVMPHRTNIQLKEHFQTIRTRTTQAKKVWTLEEDAKLIELKKKYGPNWAKIVKEIPNVNRIQARQRYSSLIRYHQKGLTLDSINRNGNTENPLLNHTTVTYTTNTPWSRESKEIFVKHLKIDDQLINFFKKDNKLTALEGHRKSYHPNKLKSDTKKLHQILLKLNANLNIQDYNEDTFELSEMNQQLLESLEHYTEEEKITLNENVEHVRLQMFGPQEQLLGKQRFIPPLPFSFCTPRCKNNISEKIDSTLDTSKFHQIELPMVLETNKYITEYLGDDTVKDFERLKKVMAASTKIFKRVYSLKCKPFASSNLFFKELEEIVSNNESRPPIPEQEMKYDWELNRMISSNSPKDTVVMDTIPAPIIEPDKSTLQAYQELLLISETFSSDSSETDYNYKLTSRGREALYLLKKRYEQLFHMPTGLSRIIPPDSVDESAFLTVLEKFKKKNHKNNKRLKNSIKGESSNG